MKSTRKIAVLCTQKNSVYHRYPNLDIYDASRDARTFPGDCPAIGHPPCRGFSLFTRHQAQPKPDEYALGIWVAHAIKRCGGILEQPAHSLLFQAAGLPTPDTPAKADSFTIEVWQAWWGYPLKKKTWLYFSRIPRAIIQLPLTLHPYGDRRREQLMSHAQRSATTPAFAQWLIHYTRQAQ